MGDIASRLCDDKFRSNPLRYIAQSLMAAASVVLVLLFLDSVSQTVLIAAFGSSAFIAFSMPHRRYARPRYLVGGYITGICVGCGLSVLAPMLARYIPFETHTAMLVMGGLATGLAMLLMAVFDTEHPPAAALALGFVLNEWDGLTVIVVIAGIAAISAIKEILKPRLIDLL